MAMACKPEEQKRLTVVPATVTGRPARIAAMRATFLPCGPCGWAQPRTTSSISAGIELRSLAQNVLDAMSGQIVGPGHVEGSAKRFGQASPGTGDDDGFSHRVIGSPLARFQDGKQRDPQHAEEVPVVADDVHQFAALRFAEHDDE